MAWTTVPVTAASSVLKAQFDEVKAAINERQTACGLSLTTTAASANGAQLRTLLTTYRTAIDNLIPYFANTDAAYVAYTKSTCLTAALGVGRTDWLGTQTPAYMFVNELNELRSVLNKISWVRYDLTQTVQQQWSYPGGGTSDISWADAWTSAQTAYAAGSFATGGAFAGFTTSAYTPSPPDAKTYYKDIANTRITDASLAVPNLTVADTKLIVTKRGYGDNFDFDLHEQASFGGSATTVAVTAAQNADVVLDVTTVAGNATAHYSARTNPAAPDPTSYVPADTNGATKGATLTLKNLLVQYTFAYRT